MRNGESHKKCPCGDFATRLSSQIRTGGNCKPVGNWLYSLEEARMPLFEFKCQDCGTTFEKIVPSSTTAVACKKCASPKVEKLFSVFAVGPTSRSAATYEPGPCGSCGAAQRGMCGVE